LFLVFTQAIQSYALVIVKHLIPLWASTIWLTKGELASPRQEREILNSVKRGSLTRRIFEAKPPNKTPQFIFSPSRGLDSF
jgi:hypothetical protein